MRPERRLKPGMEGDPRVALLVSPQQPLQHPLRTPELVPMPRGSLLPGDRDDPGQFAHFQNQNQERKSAAVRPPLHSLFRITPCWNRESDFRIILGLENAYHSCYWPGRCAAGLGSRIL